MTSLNQEIQEKLDIYFKKYRQRYTKCLIRGIEISVDGRPEEFVRQIFIHFLINQSELLTGKINIKVESNNHDIEIYKSPRNNNFRPHQNPVMIVEVKREEVNLQNHYSQIQRYLTKAGCDIGILYNYHEIIGISRKNNDFEFNYLNSLQEIQKLILHKINQIDDGLLELGEAQNGNFKSFTYLINKYGRYTTNTVTFKLKNQPTEVEGYLFSIQNNKVYYKICGQYSKKQLSFDSQDFEKLISIIY
ncbi:type I restriction enzyme HsdR N-terminal domain-containing protein [Aulosira sp. FACHB-615]|uniref:type I restriction enzyme HsdR N-terminal domain-containing protein n=1 Tax=Aulosira sp. FACHB-615 TaxID=2692777 RepID=UPI00168512B9|nr:type I restriction enzyme HsdR N-terminal domain-containing protein [Aulosira sp. FACHB-615]MBD2486817.1 type I restriction enzyme HsdR N-terminal domain-containing protein [Aulosira sp. FACHB-615]